MIDAATEMSWWITYLGHAGPRYWAIYENGRGYDDGRIGRLRNAGALPIIFTIGCESGMFMSYAPSETYRDQISSNAGTDSSGTANHAVGQTK